MALNKSVIKSGGLKFNYPFYAEYFYLNRRIYRDINPEWNSSREVYASSENLNRLSACYEILSATFVWVRSQTLLWAWIIQPISSSFNIFTSSYWCHLERRAFLVETGFVCLAHNHNKLLQLFNSYQCLDQPEGTINIHPSMNSSSLQSPGFRGRCPKSSCDFSSNSNWGGVFNWISYL
jgi:hypothetical protein